MATDFQSAEDINKHYEAQINAASEPVDQANLRAERAERLAELNARAAAEAQGRAWVSEAIAKHGVPAEIADMVRGATQEEIDKTAERLAAIAKAAPQPSAADLYGGGTGGGGTPVRTTKDADGEWLSDFEQRYNNREALSQQEYSRYVQLRLGRHAYRAFKDTGKQHLWGPQPNLEVERY